MKTKKAKAAAKSPGRSAGAKTAVRKQRTDKPAKPAAAKAKVVAAVAKKPLAAPTKPAKGTQPASSSKSAPVLAKPVARTRVAEIVGLPKAPAIRADIRPHHVDVEDEDEPVVARSSKAGGNGEIVDAGSKGGPVKTYLDAKELEEFRELLLAKRQELIRDVTNLESEAIRHSSAGGATSTMPIHMADLGSDTWEQELTLGLIENERNLLREIDEALDRVDNRTYGMCLATNRRISKARLRAKPWAKYCIEYARKIELGLA
jgi:DnaK suppressor protein